MTLIYKISNLDTHPTKGQFDKIELDLFDFMSINGDFEFYIENSLVLKQEYWNVGELAQQLLEWKKMDFETTFITLVLTQKKKIYLLLRK
jgi:hypothetical protein